MNQYRPFDLDTIINDMELAPTLIALGFSNTMYGLLYRSVEGDFALLRSGFLGVEKATMQYWIEEWVRARYGDCEQVDTYAVLAVLGENPILTLPTGDSFFVSSFKPAPLNAPEVFDRLELRGSVFEMSSKLLPDYATYGCWEPS